MNRPLLIAIGIVATVAASMYGLVLLPQQQLGGLGPVKIVAPDGTETSYPAPLDDFLEAPGHRVYRSLGCVYCHSQQVRPEGFGADIDRLFGLRRSVARDYLYNDAALLGTMRTGPDLANIGQRQTSREWHYLHFFDPRITSPESVMPPHPFLFEVVDERPRGLDGSEAVGLPDEYFGRRAWIVPKQEARELTAYVLTLQQLHDLEAVR